MEKTNNYPVVLVHGFLCWGDGSNINKFLPCFGLWNGNAKLSVYDAGLKCYTPHVGPFNSMWDRACILYAKLKGGRVDFGKVRSEKYGYQRYGETYEAMIPDWGELDTEGKIKKINLVGHSFGGPTVRTLIHLLTEGSEEERAGTPEDELSDLFKGGKGNWVHSCTTLVATHNGVTLPDAARPLVDPLQYVIYTLGNLVNRTVAMINKYFDGVLPVNDCTEELDKGFIDDILSALPVMEKAFSDFRIADAVEAVMNSAKRSNKYIDETAPWALAKDEANKNRLSTVLYNLLEAIRIIAVELTCFMPDTAKAILTQINCEEASYESILSFGAAKLGTKVGTATPLFTRIDAAVMLKEIEEEMQKKMQAAANAAEIAGIAKIGIEDFAKVDLRVATIKECEPVKKAKKLLKLTVFDGVANRTVASGIAKWYKPEDLIGKNIILVSNLKPATLCGIESQGMILAADCSEDDVKVIFVDGIPAGSKVR